MNIFKKIVKKLPKKSVAVIAVVVAALGVATAVHAWSPSRPTYTVQVPADHVTFDSITNNPDEGDERAFFQVKDNANTQPNGFSHTINNLRDGQDLLLRVYVHNDAASNLNGTNFTGKGVAKNTKVRIFLPTAQANALRANAYIDADNASPKEVADTINFGSSGLFNVTYEPGSAVQYTNAVPKGMKLSDSIVTTGAPIGFKTPNGIVPGCFEFSSIVTIKVKVHKPSYSIAKSVRFPGQTSNDWKESVTAKPGQAVEWRVAFTNTGGTDLNNVVVLDQVPAGLNVVPGTAKVYNSSNPNGFVLPSSDVQNNGRQVNVNIGKYLPSANAFLLFQTTVPQEKDLKCGTNQFVNTAYATPQGLATVADTAKVDVNNENCQPSTPAFSCDLVTVTKVNGRTVKVSVDATAINGATVTSYLYDFGDGTKVLSSQNTAEHTYAKDGDFVVRATVNFDVNGKSHSATSDKCAAPVTFTSTPTTPSTPTELTNTGPGDVAGIFVGTSLVGAFLHRKWQVRRGQ